MKRLSFLFMAAVCAVLFSCGEDEDNRAHSVTVFAGYGGAVVTADKEMAVAGETVTITATPSEGFLFKEWKVRVGNTVIEKTAPNSATFSMPVEDVVIVATFYHRNDVLERITDPALKAYCQSRMDTEQKIDGVSYPKWDIDGNGALTPNEVEAIKAIEVNGGINGMKIKELDGLNEFINLEILNLEGNELTALNTVWPKLVKLDCSHNKLENLEIGGSKLLKELYCDNNHLSLLNLKSMIYQDGYMLHCGNQKTSTGNVQTLEVIFYSDEELAFWESNLKNLDENADAVIFVAKVEQIIIAGGKNKDMEIGGTYDLNSMITVLPDDVANKSVTYTLKAGDDVVSLNNGVITVLAPGQATIEVMANDGSGVSTELTIMATWYNRTNWTVDTSILYPGGINYLPDGSTGKPEDILDGSGTTFLSLVKPGKEYGGCITPADHLLYFVVDMKEIKRFNNIEWTNRMGNSGVSGVHLRYVRLLGSNDNNDYKVIEEKLVLDYKNISTPQKLAVPESEYRYLKVEFVPGGWVMDPNSGLQVAEFRVGIQQD